MDRSGSAAVPGSAAGVGLAHGHHGEILQGVFADGRGGVCRGLVTLPVAEPVVRAVFVPRPGRPARRVTVSPADRVKAARAARLALAECARRLGRRLCGGRLQLSGGLPVGLGLGSSTGDVVAAVRAVAASCGVALSPAEVALLAVRAEGAADPVMLDSRPLLFAQREGRVLEDFGPALPATVVVGCLTGGGRPLDTLALPPPPCGAADLAAFEELRALLRRAVRQADPVLLGEVCTESARRNQRVAPKAELAALVDAARRSGAVGVQVAHSGNVAGVLFDAAAPDLTERVRDCVRRLRDSGVPVTRIFRTPSGVTEREYGQPHLRGDRQTGPGGPRQRTRLPAV